MITIESFSKQYNVPVTSIYEAKSRSSIPQYMFKKDIKKVYIDEKKIEKRHEFRSKVVNFCHDMYFLLSDKFTNAEIGRAVNKYTKGEDRSWNVFFCSNLFSQNDNGYLAYKITDKIWLFFKFCRSVYLGLRRKYKNFSLEKFLDDLMI